MKLNIVLIDIHYSRRGILIGFINFYVSIVKQVVSEKRLWVTYKYENIGFDYIFKNGWSFNMWFVKPYYKKST